MRYSPEHKLRARQKLLLESGSHAKRHGFSASGVDALAAAAGVTSGSLYKLFDGKSGLFAALIGAELDRTANLYAQVPTGDLDGARKALSGYLSLQHVMKPEQGCPLPSLAPEVARAPDAVRAVFDKGLLLIKDEVQRFTGSAPQAWSLIALSVGAVMLARALNDEQARADLLQSVQDQALKLLADLESESESDVENGAAKTRETDGRRQVDNQ